MKKQFYYIFIICIISLISYEALSQPNVLTETPQRILPIPNNSQSFKFIIIKQSKPFGKTEILCEQPDTSIKVVGTCSGNCIITFPKVAPANPMTGEPAKTNHCIKVNMNLGNCPNCVITGTWEIF